MKREMVYIVVFAGHSIGQIKATTEDEAGSRASSLALDVLTDMFDHVANPAGINRITKRARVLDKIEAAFSAVRFDVVHAPPGTVNVTRSGSKNWWPYCYVTLRPLDAKRWTGEAIDGKLVMKEADAKE